MTNLTRLLPPAAQPVSLDMVKQHLRVSTSDQDDMITLYVKAATDYIEGEWGFLGRALVSQTWRLTLDRFPGSGESWGWSGWGGGWGWIKPPSSNGSSSGQIKIPLPPLQSVSSISYDDTNGDPQTVDPGSYFVDNASEPGWVVPISSFTWPATLNAINAVRIDFIAGYSPDASSPPDLAANVPYNIKCAMLLMISSWMENREGLVETRLNPLPIAADALLRRHKIDKSMA